MGQVARNQRRWDIVVRLSGALLEPGDGLEDLYGERDPFYTVLGNVILTY